VRSAGAGGALGVVIGATVAVGLFTPGGTDVVRFGSALLQAESATDMPASTNRFEGLMRSPGVKGMRCNARHRCTARTRTSGLSIHANARADENVAVRSAFRCRSVPTIAPVIAALARKRGSCAVKAADLSIWFPGQFRVPLRWHGCCEATWSAAAPAANPLEEVTMLYYAVVFFIIALIAALFGFGGIAAGAASIAKILFVVFLIVALVTFLLSLARR
jgi:uncharacterized membrane protein YtjA (UPF0391 family)